jgi:hypothetical protein
MSALRARGVENQRDMLRLDRTDADWNNFEYACMSQVAGPDGTVERSEVSACELDIFEFDPSQSKRCRESFPMIKDCHTALYKDIFLIGRSSC